MQTNLDFRLQNRADATLKLIEKVEEYFNENDKEDWVLCSLSLDALPMVNMLSNRFDIIYDILPNKIIYAPKNAECEIGIIGKNNQTVTFDVLIDNFDVDEQYINNQFESCIEELKKLDSDFEKYDSIKYFKNKNILFVDDSAQSSLRALLGVKTAILLNAKKIAYACPIVPKEIEELLIEKIDKIFYFYSDDRYVNNQHYYVEKVKNISVDDAINITKNSDKFIGNLKGETV